MTAIVVPARSKAFTPEVMEKFLKEHQEAFGESEKPSAGGYPDMGNGRYSKELSYSAWYNFNNAQRVHYNLIE